MSEPEQTRERKRWPDDYMDPAAPAECARCPECHCKRAAVIGATPIGPMIRKEKRCANCAATYYANEVRT